MRNPVKHCVYNAPTESLYASQPSEMWPLPRTMGELHSFLLLTRDARCTGHLLTSLKSAELPARKSSTKANLTLNANLNINITLILKLVLTLI